MEVGEEAGRGARKGSSFSKVIYMLPSHIAFSQSTPSNGLQQSIRAESPIAAARHSF